MGGWYDKYDYSDMASGTDMNMDWGNSSKSTQNWKANQDPANLGANVNVPYNTDINGEPDLSELSDGAYHGAFAEARDNALTDLANTGDKLHMGMVDSWYGTTEPDIRNYTTMEQYQKKVDEYNQGRAIAEQLQQGIDERNNARRQRFNSGKIDTSMRDQTDDTLNDVSPEPKNEKKKTEDESSEESFNRNAEGYQDIKTFDDAYQAWAADRGITGYRDASDFQFNGNNSGDWLDFSLWTNDKLGWYDDHLRDVLGDEYYNAYINDRNIYANDPDTYALMQTAYDNWYTPWVNTHTIQDILDGNTVTAAEMIGGWQADADRVAQYLLDNYAFGQIAANANLSPEEVQSLLQNGTPGVDYFELDSPEGQQFARQALNNMLLQAALLNENFFTDADQLDAMGTIYDTEGGIDYDRMNSPIANMQGAVYGSAGGDVLTDAALATLVGMNPWDASFYLQNANFGLMAQQALANQLGYGSNQNYAPEDWAALQAALQPDE